MGHFYFVETVFAGLGRAIGKNLQRIKAHLFLCLPYPRQQVHFKPPIQQVHFKFFLWLVVHHYNSWDCDGHNTFDVASKAT